MKALKIFVCTFFLIFSAVQSQVELMDKNIPDNDKTLSPYFLVKSDNPDVDQLPLYLTKADVNIVGVIADVP